MEFKRFNITIDLQTGPGSPAYKAMKEEGLSADCFVGRELGWIESSGIRLVRVNIPQNPLFRELNLDDIDSLNGNI